jgi:chemosensory pili system protein ChpA (sensor histidine kinase/response regulator)
MSDYFAIFAGELRGYIEQLHTQELVVASPTRSGSTLESALEALQRLGHTLAGLGATVDLADVALLGTALEDAMGIALTNELPSPRRVAVPITYLAMHLEARLTHMRAAGRFVPPDAGEIAEAQRIVDLLQLAPFTTSNISPSILASLSDTLPTLTARGSGADGETSAADGATTGTNTADGTTPETSVTDGATSEATSPRLETIALPGYDGREQVRQGRDESRPYNDQGEDVSALPASSAEGEQGSRGAGFPWSRVPVEQGSRGATGRRDDGTTAWSDAMEPPDDIQQIIEGFLQSRLSRSDITFLQAEPPMISDDHLTIFLDEMSDDLRLLRHLLAQVTSMPNSTDALTQMNQVAHKIKGSAFTTGLPSIGGIGDMLETMITALRQGQAALDAEAVRWLIQALDDLEALHARVSATREDDGDIMPLARLHERYAHIMAAAGDDTDDPFDTGPLTVPAPEVAPLSTTTHLSAVAQRPTMRIEARRVGQVMATLSTMQISLIELARLRGEAAGSEQEIERILARVTDLYDRLRAERMIASANGMRGGEVDPAALSAGPRRTPVPPILAQWLAQHRSAPRNGKAPELEYYSEFDVLMAMVGEVISDLRAMHLRLQTALNQTQHQQEYHDFLTDAVQRDVLALRLTPLADIITRVQFAVQTVAHEESKQVEFIAEGDDIALDGDIAAAMLDPLVQVARNAVVHGIETSDERAAAGKVTPAQVRLRAAHDGDGILITISDNGRGINPQRLIASAMLVTTPTGPLLTAERARTLTTAEAFDLMFLSDVSTAVEIRPTAGRGMGLPTVRRAVESVRGNVSFSSTPGEGTTFSFRLPPSLTTARAITVRAGGGDYAVPIRDLRRFVDVSPAQIFTTTDGQVRVRVRDVFDVAYELPVATLAELLGQEVGPTPGTIALVIGSGQQEYAVIVDAIGDERDLIIRPVPRHLRRRSVQGAAITAQGGVVLILDLPNLIAGAVASGQIGQRTPQLAPTPLGQPENYILVVDDSPSIRHGLAAMLHELDYTVETARDGIEAIEHINRAHPRLIILDVEMPHMNGYELLEVLHAYEPYHDLRAIMLTSRATGKYRDYALKLGAVDYLVKPVSSEALHAAIARAWEQ